MHEPDPESFDLKLVQVIITRTIFNAFPDPSNGESLTKSEADDLVLKIISIFYFIGYRSFIYAMLGLTNEDINKIHSLEELLVLVYELDHGFAYLNLFASEYFSPILLIE